jgi:exopolysaccharide biosynthesis predicted pyruvyltransferase EpsI
MKQKLDTLRAQISHVLDPLIPVNSNCVLIDFPHHENVGDSAIWLGEIEYLRYRRCHIAYISDISTFEPDAMRSALQGGTILLHGGGNFGDLYSHHQKFRERIAELFPDCRIIQLPQSIHFSDDSKIKDWCSNISRHRNFHMLVRDRPSLEIAQKHLPNPVHLCPDMALMLDIPPLSSHLKSASILILSRTDQEKSSIFTHYDDTSSNHIAMDWMDEEPPAREALYDWAHRRLRWRNSKVPPFLLNRLALYAANAIARERLARGLSILGKGRVIVTDRLHALILSWLGGLPVLYLDNTYRKLGNFLDAWLPNEAKITPAASFDDAIMMANEVLLSSDELPTSTSREKRAK